MKRYLIIDVGCLECGAPTTIVGWSDTVPKGARLVTYGDEWSEWTGDGVVAALDTHSPIPDYEGGN